MNNTFVYTTDEAVGFSTIQGFYTLSTSDDIVTLKANC